MAGREEPKSSYVSYGGYTSVPKTRTQSIYLLPEEVEAKKAEVRPPAAPHKNKKEPDKTKRKERRPAPIGWESWIPGRSEGQGAMEEVDLQAVQEQKQAQTDDESSESTYSGQEPVRETPSPTAQDVTQMAACSVGPVLREPIDITAQLTPVVETQSEPQLVSEKEPRSLLLDKSQRTQAERRFQTPIDVQTPLDDEQIPLANRLVSEIHTQSLTPIKPHPSDPYYTKPRSEREKGSKSPLKKLIPFWGKDSSKTPPRRKSSSAKPEGWLEVPSFQAVIPDEKAAAGVMHMVRSQGRGVVSAACNPLYRDGFFHGLLPKEDLERMLSKNGDFLTRESEMVFEGKNVLMPTLSVRWNKQMKHFLVGRTKKGRYHLGFHMFDTVADLVEWYRLSQCHLSANADVVLKTPIRRRRWQLSHDQVRLISKLGEGAFGEVHRGILIQQSSSMEVAVKILKPTNQRTSDRKERVKFLSEFKVMRKFDHPNVVKVLGVAALNEPMMIVMEFLVGGSLVHYLRQRRINAPLSQRVRFCAEAAAGLHYLENRKCMHRDVAARNCLMGAKNEVKIADFGLSKFDVRAYHEQKGQKMPIRWLAPETLRTGVFSPETDVWSFGILMWEVFSDGKEPYPGKSNTQVREQVTQHCYRMRIPMGTPKQVEDLINKCWQESPRSRPKFTNIHKTLSNLSKSMN